MANKYKNIQYENVNSHDDNRNVSINTVPPPPAKSNKMSTMESINIGTMPSMMEIFETSGSLEVDELIYAKNTACCCLSLQKAMKTLCIVTLIGAILHIVVGVLESVLPNFSTGLSVKNFINLSLLLGLYYLIASIIGLIAVKKFNKKLSMIFYIYTMLTLFIIIGISIYRYWRNPDVCVFCFYVIFMFFFSCFFIFANELSTNSVDINNCFRSLLLLLLFTFMFS